MSQTDDDIELVRRAMTEAGFSPVGGARPAFERIVAELKRVTGENDERALYAMEREESREVGE